MNLNKIPTTIVTGFLGSGKTTLLSQIIKNAQGKRIAVVVNEFGELDIDADLIRNCPLPCDDDINNQANDSGVYELANGCICCTVEEEFLPVMQQLVARRDQIDHILIETSGLALPKPLVQAFNWPEIKNHCTVDSVIAVVDGPAIANQRYAHDPELVAQQRLADDSLDHDPSLKELLDDQLSSADLVLVSKNDLLADHEHQKVTHFIQETIGNKVKILPMINGHIDPRLILGIGAATEQRIEQIHTHHDHHHTHDKEHHHAHEAFCSVSIQLPEVNSQQLQDAIKQLIADHHIYRVKGFAAIHGKPMRQVIQAVGPRLETYFDRLWQTDEAKTGRLVFIGKTLDQTVIEQSLLSATA